MDIYCIGFIATFVLFFGIRLIFGNQRWEYWHLSEAMFYEKIGDHKSADRHKEIASFSRWFILCLLGAIIWPMTIMVLIYMSLGVNWEDWE